MKASEIIGKRIRDRRVELGLSQEELAKKLGYSGKSMISLIESGKRELGITQISPLAKILECSVGDLVDDIIPDDDELLYLFSRLSPDQREAARNFLQAMLGDK